MTDTLNPTPGAFVVIAEVIHGPHAESRLGDSLYCSLGCADAGVRDLVCELRDEEGGSGFVLPHGGRSVGCVVTRGGRMWAVRIFASSELPPI